MSERGVSIKGRAQAEGKDAGLSDPKRRDAEDAKARRYMGGP